jgi:hypothetical protein
MLNFVEGQDETVLPVELCYRGGDIVPIERSLKQVFKCPMSDAEAGRMVELFEKRRFQILSLLSA